MVYPLMKKMLSEKRIKNPHWVALNPIGPHRVSVNSIIIHNISLESTALDGYSRFKEAIWRNMHRLEETPINPKHLTGFGRYNWTCCEKMLNLQVENNFDVFYIHDFQQLPIGAMLGPNVHKIFTWHIPFDSGIKKSWLNFIVKYLEDYEAVIMSCKKYADELEKSGFKGKVYQIYPHLDETKYLKPPASKINELCEKFGIKDDEKVILVVGRVVPVKGQDVVVKALPRILKRFKDVKLVLAGNGSFSGSMKGGLGLMKTPVWRGVLEYLIKDLEVENNVVFTGYLPQEELNAIYERADLTVFPSLKDGFGFVPVESWLHKKTCIISKGAGISELVKENENGLLFTPKKHVELSEKIMHLLSKPELCSRIGEKGFGTAKKCSLENGVKSVSNVFSEVLENV
ncbi:MAG: glycosyltransferase family 4 protein [Thermoplasmatales archaeon]|nr:glycosyltransferase family 4 protein [Thermoplasmatales archaeon]